MGQEALGLPPPWLLRQTEIAFSSVMQGRVVGICNTRVRVQLCINRIQVGLKFVDQRHGICQKRYQIGLAQSIAFYYSYRVLLTPRSNCGVYDTRSIGAYSAITVTTPVSSV